MLFSEYKFPEEEVKPPSSHDQQQEGEQEKGKFWRENCPQGIKCRRFDNPARID